MKVCLVGYQTQSQGFGLGKDKSVDKIQIHANLLKFVISLHSANFDILYLGEFCLELNLVVDESSLVGVSKWRNWGGGLSYFYLSISVAEPELVGADTFWSEPVWRCEGKNIFYYFLAYFYMKRSRSLWKKSTWDRRRSKKDRLRNTAKHTIKENYRIKKSSKKKYYYY